MEQIKDFMTSEDPLLSHLGKTSFNIYQQWQQNKISKDEYKVLVNNIADEKLLDNYSETEEDLENYKKLLEKLKSILLL